MKSRRSRKRKRRSSRPIGGQPAPPARSPQPPDVEAYKSRLEKFVVIFNSLRGVEGRALLSPSHAPLTEVRQQPSSSPPQRHSEPAVVSIVIASLAWQPNGDTSNPLVDFLANGNKSGRRKKATGWLRRSEAMRFGIECNKVGNKKMQLTEEENTRLVEIKRELDSVRQRYDNTWPHGITPIADLRHAYDVSESKVKACVKKYMNQGFSSKRKERSDTGETIFTSQRKRDSEFTPYSYYSKLQRMRHNVHLSGEQLAEGFSTLDAITRHQCEVGAANLKGIVINIRGEIEWVMKQCNGNISW